MALEQVGMRLVVEGLTGYVNDLKKAEGAQKGLGDSADQATAKASKWATAGAAVNKFALASGAALLGVGAASAKMATDFDTGIRRVNTVAKLPEAQLDALRGQVLALSDDLGVTTNDILPGMYDALSAGVPAENVLTFMEIASKAAIGGITTTSIAADGLTTAINAFGLKADDTQRVADVMFKTVELGKTTFDDLATQLYDVAPAAAASSVSLEETGAAIAVLTAQGTPTRVATTQIRQAILALQKPTDQLTKVFKAAGFESGEAAIKQKGLAVAMGIVRDASGGSNAKLAQLIGSVEAMQGVLGLTGPNAVKMATALDAMKNSAGSADAAFEEMNKSTARQIEEMKVRLQNLLIVLGDNLLPVIENVVSAILTMADGAQKLGDIIGRLPGPLQDALTMIVGIGGASLVTVAALKGLGTVLGIAELKALSATGAFGSMSKAIMPLIAPLGFTAAGLGVAFLALKLEGMIGVIEDGIPALGTLEEATRAFRVEIAGEDLDLETLQNRLAKVSAKRDELFESTNGLTEATEREEQQFVALVAESDVLSTAIIKQKRAVGDASEAHKQLFNDTGKLTDEAGKLFDEFNVGTDTISGYELGLQSAGRIARLEFMPKIKDATEVIEGMRQAAEETQARLIAMIEEPSEDELHAKYQLALAQDALAIFDAKHAGEELTEEQQAQRDELQRVIDQWDSTTRTYETARAALEAQFEWLDKVTENLRDQGDAAATVGFRVHNETVPAVLDLTEALEGVPETTDFDVSSPSLNRAVLDAHELLNTLRDISQQPPPPGLRGMANPTPPGARSIQQILQQWLTLMFPTDELLPTLRPPGGWQDFFFEQTPMLEERMPWLDELRRQRQRTRRPFEPPEDELTLDEVTDPARIMEIVQRAIDTITKISETDIPALARPKVKRIADNMALILREFSRAMEGIGPEAAHAAALVATTFEPIMKAIDASIGVLGDPRFGDYSGANMQGYRTLLANMAEAALIASQTLGTLDISEDAARAISTAGRAAAEALRFLPDAIDVLGDPRVNTYGGANMAGVRALMDNLAEFTLIAVERLSHFDLASVTTATQIMEQLGDMIRVLRQIVGSGDGGGGGVPIPGGEVPPPPVPSVPDPGAFSMMLPYLGQRFEGAPGGDSYTVNATYVNPQDPHSIRIDLIAMQMQAAL